MLINGREILPKIGQPEKIQAEINKIEGLKSDLKSENEPKKGEIYITDDGMGEIGFSLFDKDDDKGRERKIRYDYFKEMDTSEFIHRALEIVADDSTQTNPDGNAIKIYSNDEEVKKILMELFTEKLDMNNELWSIVFETCKMGDNFYEVVVNDYKNPKNVIFLRYLEPEKVDRIEENGRLSYYTYKTKERAEDKQREAKKYGYETGEEVIYKLQPWQIIHFKLENKGFNPYGASLLYSGLKTYRRLNLLEDVMIVYRLSRAPERRVFYIDVGNLNKVEAKRFLEKVKNSYRTSSFIDENGNINKKARMLSITNDIFVPVREGQQGTKIETLQGGQALHNIDDMKYFRDKILRTMNIPPAYLGDESDRSRGSLSQLDIKFSRFIERIQTQMIKGVNKIAALELFFAGFKKEQLTDFEIELTPPSNIKEITEIDLMGQKMNLLASIQQLNVFSNQWMLKNILKLSDAEIADIELYRRLEAANAPPGEEVPGATGIPGTGSETPLPPGEEALGLPAPEAGEAGVTPPEEAGVPTPTTPEELAASTIMKSLGKEFIMENQKDFFKILKYINEKNNETPIQSISEWSQLKEDLGEIFVNKESDPNTNNVRRQFIINEFGGIKFKNGNNEASIEIFESVKENKKTTYKSKTIILD